MTIVFRTNCNGTLGHLARCRHLSVYLESQGYTTCFLLDSRPDFTTTWIETLKWQPVYDSPSGGFVSEIDDVSHCLDSFAALAPTLVIVDDYRLGKTWEQAVKQEGYLVLAIDDLRRRHDVDILLEPRYEESADSRQHKPSCIRLQGTRYTLLDPAYGEVDKTRKDKFTILFSLGGGGDLALFNDCIEQLLDLTGNCPRKS